MTSSKTPKPYVIDLDFIQDELRKEDERKRRAEEAQKAAAAPKLSDADIEAAREEGYKRGMQEGHSAGHNEATALYETHIQSIYQKLQDVSAIKETYKGALTSHTLSLLQKLIPQIVGEKLSEDITPLLMHHVEKLHHIMARETGLILRINAETKDVLTTLAEEKKLALSHDITIENDNTLNAGDITLHWGNQGVEAILEHTLHHTDETLAGAEATLESSTSEFVPHTTAPAPTETTTTDPTGGDIAPQITSSPLPEDYFEISPGEENAQENAEDIKTASTSPQSES